MRLSIGIGGTRLHDLPDSVAPIIELPPLDPDDPPAGSITPKVSQKQTSSSYSMSATFYMGGVVEEGEE